MPSAFDNISHNPQACQSLCKHLHSCSRSFHRKPYRRGPHLHYKLAIPWETEMFAVTTNKVVMIIHGESGEVGNRDVIVQWRYGGGLQRMNELTPFYNPLQYFLFSSSKKMGGMKICSYRTIKTEHTQGSQWWLITHKECTLAVNSSLCISVVAFFSNISSTLLPRQNKTLLTFWC
jgi:hypothetical protein